MNREFKLGSLLSLLVILKCLLLSSARAEEVCKYDIERKACNCNVSNKFGECGDLSFINFSDYVTALMIPLIDSVQLKPWRELRQSGKYSQSFENFNTDERNLRGTIWNDAYLPFANFKNADLRGAAFRRAIFSYSTFAGADLRDSDFTDGFQFSKPEEESETPLTTTFEEVDFSYANLENASVKFVNLRGSDFLGVKAAKASFDNSLLNDARLTTGSFSETSFVSANLSGALADFANFNSAVLLGATLIRTDARGSDFTAASMKGVQAHYANFARSRLPNSIIAEATWKNFGGQGAIIDNETRLVSAEKGDEGSTFRERYSPRHMYKKLEAIYHPGASRFNEISSYGYNGETERGNAAYAALLNALSGDPTKALDEVSMAELIRRGLAYYLTDFWPKEPDAIPECANIDLYGVPLGDKMIIFKWDVKEKGQCISGTGLPISFPKFGILPIGRRPITLGPKTLAHEYILKRAAHLEYQKLNVLTMAAYSLPFGCSLDVLINGAKLDQTTGPCVALDATFFLSWVTRPLLAAKWISSTNAGRLQIGAAVIAGGGAVYQGIQAGKAFSTGNTGKGFLLTADVLLRTLQAKIHFNHAREIFAADKLVVHPATPQVPELAPGQARVTETLPMVYDSSAKYTKYVYTQDGKAVFVTKDLSPEWAAKHMVELLPDGRSVVRTNVYYYPNNETHVLEGFQRSVFEPLKDGTFRVIFKEAFYNASAIGSAGNRLTIPSKIAVRGKPQLLPNGDPAHAFFKWQQAGLVGVPLKSVRIFKIENIQNITTIAQMAQQIKAWRAANPGKSLPPEVLNRFAEQTHSAIYTKTVAQQMGMTNPTVKIEGGGNTSLGELLQFFEQKDPSLLLVHNQILAKYGLTREEMVWAAFDILLQAK